MTNAAILMAYQTPFERGRLQKVHARLSGVFRAGKRAATMDDRTPARRASGQTSRLNGGTDATARLVRAWARRRRPRPGRAGRRSYRLLRGRGRDGLLDSMSCSHVHAP